MSNGLRLLHANLRFLDYDIGDISETQEFKRDFEENSQFAVIVIEH